MRIGHVHLKVADLDRSVAFYRDVLGFELRARMPGAAFLADDGYHHHIGLNTWASAGGQRLPAPRACFTWPSCTRRARSWPLPCAACSKRALPSAGRQTTG